MTITASGDASTAALEEGSKAIRPRTWENTTDWLNKANAAWQFRPPVDIYGVVEPNIVEAASGHTLTVKFRCGPGASLLAGAHLTMEIPETWDCHLGNTFRRGIRTVGNRQQIQNGYGAFAEVACSNSEVGLALEVSYGRVLDLVDVVITHGTVQPGDEIRIVLGVEDGNLIQAQKFAQQAIFTSAVDIDGNGEYRRVATHPTVKVVGAFADRFRVFAPGVVVPGEPFPIRILPVDIYSFNPAPTYRGTAQITPSDSATAPALQVPSCITVTDEQAAGYYGMQAATVQATATTGVYSITVVDAEQGLIGKSNPIGAGFLQERGIFFGEMHSQMWASMGTGSTEEFFLWGRDVAGLDFCAPANHYGRRFEVTDEVWQALVDTCNRFDNPGRFATLVSYEWGGGRTPNGHSGHKNVYYRGDHGPFHHWYKRVHDSPDDLWRDLAEYQALTVPHHTRALGGVDWHFRNDRFQRLVEICSQWGISEQGGPHSVQAALAMGHRLGFVGGTDSHYGLANQGSYHVNDGNGLACVQATDLSRDSIWQALYERRCYATTGDRILLDYSLNGHPMGSDVPVDLAEVGARRVTVRLAGTATITRVELLRNNQVIWSAEPNADVFEEEWIDREPLLPLALQPAFTHDRPFVFYYVRVTQVNRQQAWSSPVWLTQCAPPN
ncbi:MAG TPA: DUF3604 domain-containing protein [Chloroflexota bacterium]|nr:DUF3604 domain-containing protein [Chloroflexota bacterium]